MTGLDYGRFEALTFDCYGTLIDWESGILAGLRPMLARGGIDASGRRAAGGLRGAGGGGRGRPLPAVPGDPPRRAARAGRPSMASHRTRRRPSVRRFGRRLAGVPRFDRGASPAARTLPPGRHHQLRRRPVRPVGRAPGDDFDWVVTAQAAGSYKPSEHNFEVALERIGLPRERILHVAQSLYHDHVTAKRLGFDDGLDRPPARPPGGGRDPTRRCRRRTPRSRTWPRSPRGGRRAGRCSTPDRDVVRQERRPAAVVAVPPVLAAGAERLPAAVLDLDPRRRLAARSRNRISTSVASARSRRRCHR